MTTRKRIERDYEKIIGRVPVKVEDLSTSSRDGFRIIFQDGSFLEVYGNAYGMDIEYEGLYYKFTNPKGDK